jgi:hypothetical protein
MLNRKVNKSFSTTFFDGLALQSVVLTSSFEWGHRAVRGFASLRPYATLRAEPLPSLADASTTFICALVISNLLEITKFNG